jgi:hypothetical protein
MRYKRIYFIYLLLGLILVAFSATMVRAKNGLLFDKALLATGDHRVNVPYLGPKSPAEFFTPAIFWFGQISPNDNYADVRTYFYEKELNVVLHIIDRHIWCDQSGDPQELQNWDAVSIYFNLDGNNEPTPDESSYRLDAQVDCWGTYSQNTFMGGGSGWRSEPIPFSYQSSWRGEGGPNTNKWDSGWMIHFRIPFSSFGLQDPPAFGSQWGFGIELHDRDDSQGTLLQQTTWPEGLENDNPSTWGEMAFGSAGNMLPKGIQTGAVTIRQGLNGVFVEDAHVGGHGDCGYGLDYWEEWGNKNYAGYDQINIQNQWDIADWGCFSKYYVTFPLDSIPAGQTILSATLRMTLFGNAGGGDWGEPPDSYIQVLTVGEEWEEEEITWNNAPLAVENISGTWVQPKDYGDPDVPYYWDVSRAVADAYRLGNPVRLALYSADGERHSGKYFWSSDTGDWNADARPTLFIVFGTPCDEPGIDCNFSYLPLSQK